MTLDEFESIWGPPPMWLERFLLKAVPLPPDEDQEMGCNYWCAATSKGGQRKGGEGYGSFTINQKLKGVRAHMCIATATGLVTDFRSPQGMHVDHICKRSLCVEPRHFRLLPGKENVRERWSGPARALTEEQIDIIRMRGVRPGLQPTIFLECGQ